MLKLQNSQHLKQSLNINSTVKQSINVLQMSALEVENFILQELEINPFLELKDEIPDNSDGKLYENNDYIKSSHKNDQEHDPINNVVVQKSLYQYVTEQIACKFSSPQEMLVALQITQSLDERGYVTIDLAEISVKLACSLELVENVLAKLQTIEPIGLFARNLQESLLIQLRSEQEDSQEMQILVNNLDLIASGTLSKLKSICAVSDTKLQDMLGKLKKLNPKPASYFEQNIIQVKIADVILLINDQQNFTIIPNDTIFTQIYINQELLNRSKFSINSAADKNFIRQHLNSANNVLKFVEHRWKTLLSVTKVIADKQRNFFLYGLMYFIPLTLKDIAIATGYNESTISRCINNKYVQTPSGTYELKYFFSSSVASKNNSKTQISSTKVKEIIKQLLSDKNAQSITDSQIMQELLKFNIKIARRTVNKYRNSLNI